MTTYVLITGACHGGWAWRPVAEHMRAAGHRVLTPTLPGLADGDDPTRYTLDDVIDHVVDLFTTEDLTDVTLIGHSWGGCVITGVANKISERISKVVYWSAFVPDGTSLLEECPPHYQEMFTQLAEASGTNSVVFPYEVFKAGFMQDASEDVQKLVHGLLVPQPMQYFTTPVPPLDAAALGVEAVYLLSEDDLGLPPGEYGWTRFADRLGVEPIMAPGSHEACFTRPEELAAAFMKV